MQGSGGRRVVFLDRDGTLNREQGFVAEPAQLCVLPGAADALRALDAVGFSAVVLTNQSGIARGLYTEADLARVNERLHAELERIPLAYLHCPHHPEGDPATGYAGGCDCRKPQGGLIDRAERLLGIEARGAFLVGDSARDLLMGQGRGLRTVLVRSGKPWREELARLHAARFDPDHVADHLRGAVAWILGRAAVG
jgi:D-glycero-D-manno-heptose 1,7-bisphosphate phosphatase